MPLRASLRRVYRACRDTEPKVRRALAWGLGGLLVLVATFAGAVAMGPPKVPADAIAKSVRRDAALLERAWALPAAATFGKRVDFQVNGSVCGPASLSNVFRSLGAPVGDASAVVEGSGKCQLFGICFMGLTLDELAAIARLRTQRKVTVLRNLTPERFRAELVRSNDPSRRYVVNFHRKPIFGAGGGHHSPIAGYLPDEDLVFVLDVNRDFQPWLVERSRLFAALDTVDSASGKKRGLLVIE
jgi:hypothetical protein